MLVGETRQELGGTEWAAARGLGGGEVPRTDPAALWPGYQAVAGAISRRPGAGGPAVGRGGLLTSLFLMARASGLGLAIDLARARAAGAVDWEGLLLGETTGRLLLAVEPARLEPCGPRWRRAPRRHRAFDASARLRIGLGATPLVDAPVEALARAWKREGRAS